MPNASQKRQQAFSAMLGASVRKEPIVKGPLKDCSHVLEGDVWCDVCAMAQLKYARAIYQKAMVESSRSSVKAAALNVLTAALKEYSLSDKGFAELKNTYLVFTQKNDKAHAEKTYKQIQEFSSLRAKRRQDARTKQSKKQAIAAQMYTAQHALPPVGKNGKATTNGATIRYSNHARARMELREVTEAMVEFAFTNPVSLYKGNGVSWSIEGTDVTLAGLFIDESYGKTFFIKTLWRNDAPIEEKESETTAL
jgi:hypothetical protein